MPLLDAHGTPVEDGWTDLADNAAADNAAARLEGPVIVGLERWRADREALAAGNAPLGIRLKSHQLAGEIAGDLGRFSLVVIEFPKFRDGRGFSTARELRERYGFQGEIRAVGHLIPDQYQFLARSGFSVVAVREDADLESWRKALTAVTIAYQPGVGPAGGPEEPVSLLRRHVR